MVRKYLSAAGLFNLVKKSFYSVADHRVQSNVKYKLADTLSAGLALFSFKYSSLAVFLKNANDPQIGGNIRSLFKIGAWKGKRGLKVKPFYNYNILET